MLHFVAPNDSNVIEADCKYMVSEELVAGKARTPHGVEEGIFVVHVETTFDISESRLFQTINS